MCSLSNVLLQKAKEYHILNVAFVAYCIVRCFFLNKAVPSVVQANSMHNCFAKKPFFINTYMVMP